MGVGTWSKKTKKHPYVINEQPLRASREEKSGKIVKRAGSFIRYLGVAFFLEKLGGHCHPGHPAPLLLLR